MRRRAVSVVAVLVAAGCGLGGQSGGDESRTVLMDYSHDEFASYFLRYFPRQVTVHPGDTVVFRQTWTGEPHTVTMGTTVDQRMQVVLPYIEKLARGEPLPDEEPVEVIEAWKDMPVMLGEPGEVNQVAAQPCYLETGMPPADPDEPCAEREQPEFDGKQSYFNSGFVPYQGPGGNEFRLKLADEIAPGTYNYYCNLHGNLMSGQVIVAPDAEPIPSQVEVSRQARKELAPMAEPLLAMYRGANSGRLELPVEMREMLLGPGQRYFGGNLAGLLSPMTWWTAVNEFIPETIRTTVGTPVTWTVLGPHTISFAVPSYFPIYEFGRDGAVRRNPKLDPPAGGSPDLPSAHEEKASGAAPDESAQEGPPPPLIVNGGSWNGEGFWSSGLLDSFSYSKYTMRFTSPGTYKYACLIHPPMVGTVEVRAA